ncbi:MAG: phosphoenolpyruvate synthase [Candidatus Beckwithbacteria bacterium]|nr:phosphoenolpyruvate synthase [Patescibacteria group bacterium]
MTNKLPYVVDFKDVDRGDIGLVGGKGANLGEMIKNGFPVPPGFAVTSEAYYRVLDENNLRPQIKELMSKVDVHDPRNLNAVSKKIKHLIFHATVPNEIALDIIRSYLKLSKGSNNTLVAVRSSATAEDLPDASFAGQQETYLNVQGEANLIQNVRACWASLFEPRAIFYRTEKNFDHFKVGIAVPIQKMIQSEVSGIMFTVNPVTNDKNQIVIESVWGLGEMIVQGAYTPDHYLVQKGTWKILQKQVNQQDKQLVLVKNKNKEIKVKRNKRNKEKLNNEQIVELAKIGHKIQQHYFFPQDIEWALEKGKLYIVQSRPVTTIYDTSNDPKEKDVVQKGLKLIIKGDPASPGIATGFVRILKSAKEIHMLKDGEMLVTNMTTPDFVPAMKKASAIITNKGGQTSHAAIVSRELGIPCIVGTKFATKQLKSGTVVTVNGKTGEVFAGGLLPDKNKINAPKKLLKQSKITSKKQFNPDLLPTATKIYVNLGEPDLASTIALKNVDGVGLLRAEFMIAQMGVHPKKLIHDKKSDKFVDGLVEGLEKFTKSFYPRPVVYRTTDFKTNEYANLIGGSAFEPKEPNPMIGYRGAFRYIKDQEVFDLELKAISKVRNKLGYKNLHIMVPFIRTVDQLIEVKKIISAHGLVRSPSFKLWMMVEIPSNVILLEDFLKVGIDGVSIGTNDLTMLLLGTDRDNSEVAEIFDERNPAVLWALEKIIKTCSKHKITSSICGQAPSRYPDLSLKLVKWGISSVSVSPDMIDETRQIVYQAEKSLISHAKNS